MRRKTSMPVIYMTKSGKEYFIVNKERIFVDKRMTKKEIAAIYKLLKRKLKRKSKSSQVVNSAKAIVNINNPAPKRRRRNKKNEPFVSTLNDGNRVTTSGRDPKDSGDKDLIN